MNSVSFYFFNDLKTYNINEFECFILLYNTNHSPKYQGHGFHELESKTL